MIFVIGLWTFLRALFFGSAAIALENPSLNHLPHHSQKTQD